MKKAVLGIVGLIVLVVVGLGLWLFAFNEAEEELSLEDAVAQVEQDQLEEPADVAPEDQEPGDGGEDEALVDTETEVVEPGATLEDFEGIWTVQSDSPTNVVGYRINEVLTTVGAIEVTGRTSDVTGTVNVTGTTIDAVEITAQLDTLTTGNGARDNALRTQALETDAFPTATFTLTEPFELESVPVEGVAFSVDAVGDLSIHGIRNSVNFPLSGRLVGSEIVVFGSLDILLDDYQIDAPSAPIVASVEDNAILELTVVLGR